MYFRHGDPEADFDRLDAELARYEARLPKCERCKHTIYDDDYYDVDGEILCEECLKEKYGKSCHDYAEGHE